MIYRGFRVRMGIHTGNPSCEEDPVTKRMDYFGPMVNRSARVEGVAHGGQIVLSSDVWEEVKDKTREFDDPEVTLLGDFKLKGLETETRLYQLLPPELTGRKFPKEEKPEDEREKKFKTLEQELEELKKENEALGSQFNAMRALFEEAKSKMVEFVDLLKESAGEDASLLEALDDLNKIVQQQEETKEQQKRVKKAAQEAAEVASAPSPDWELLQQKLDNLRAENEKLRVIIQRVSNPKG